MKFEIPQKDLKNIVDIISTIRDDVKIAVDGNVLSISAVDPSHIAMITLSYDKLLNVEGEAETFGVDVKKIAETLKMGKTDTNVKVLVDGDTINLSFGRITRKVSAIDSRTIPDINPPKLSYENNVILQADDLKTGIGVAGLVSEHIGFELKDYGELRLFGENETDKSEFTLSGDDIKDSDIKSEANSSYAVNYLSSFVKHLLGVNTLELQIGTEFPITIKANGSFGSISYLLAPKIKE